jgi:glycosyltransferase involved in cell wall biosynthesis
MKVIAPVPYFPPFKVNWRWKYSQIVKHEVIENVEIFHPRYFMIPKIGMPWYGFMMFLSVLPTAIRIAKKYDFDLIDSHFVYPDGLAAVLLGRILKKPVVVSARGTDINLYKDLPRIRPLLQKTLSKANRVISVCQALKEEILKLGIPCEKVSVVPNGVDKEKFYHISKGRARKELGLPLDKLILLSVGSLIPRKGHDLLIKALGVLHDKYHEKDCRLVIVGEGRLRRELEELITARGLEEYVCLPGEVTHNKLALWYSAADLFCLASNREGWPNVLMESMACGTPVVAANVWGVPEIMRNDAIGVLTERKVTSLAAGIASSLKRNWQPSVIENYARNRTWDEVALSVRTVFDAAVNRKRS